jgi:hypothetical protein
MDFSELPNAMDNLPDDQLECLKAHLAERDRTTHKPQTAEEWMSEFADIAAEFRGNSSDEEMQEIIEAMTFKSLPSEKGL